MINLTKELVVKELFNALNLVKQNPWLVAISSIIDAFFFVAWGFFATPFSDQIVANTVLLGNKISPILAANKTGILLKLFQDPLKQYTGKLLIIIVLYFVVLYTVYVIFQGISWWLCTQIAKQKNKQKNNFRSYFKGFAKINLVWLSFFVLYKVLDIFFSMKRLIINKFAPGSFNISGGILTILFTFLFFAAIASYPKLQRSTITKMNPKTTVLLIILASSIYLSTQFLLKHIGKINVDLALLVGIAVLFPIITLIKVYITRVVIHDRKHN